MRAAVNDRYGPPEVVRVTERPRPVPGPGEVLVQVAATTVTTADWRLRAADFPGIAAIPGRLMFGIFRPRRTVQGGEFSGTVAALGAGVTRFRVGDPVMGFCGQGAHAEYLTMAADGPIVPKPDALDHRQAAALPFGALSALVFLRDFAELRPGQRVLVLGASGGVGVAAVQLARAMGAEVTAVAGPDRQALLRRLGADHVVDYTRSDPLPAGAGYDVILDTAGIARFARARRALAPTGRMIALEWRGREVLQALWSRLRGGPRLIVGVSGDTRADLETIAADAAAGRLVAVIDSVWPLERIAEAHARVETRHKAGSVVVDLAA